jgi:hypothetical protein
MKFCPALLVFCMAVAATGARSYPSSSNGVDARDLRRRLSDLQVSTESSGDAVRAQYDTGPRRVFFTEERTVRYIIGLLALAYYTLTRRE